LLKSELNEKELKSHEKFEEIRQNLENENKTLSEQLKKLNADFKTQMDEFKVQQTLEAKSQIDNLIKENEVISFQNK
jgi:hypothetical protein